MNKKILGPTERKQTIQEMRFFLIQNSGGTRQRLKKKKKKSAGLPPTHFRRQVQKKGENHDLDSAGCRKDRLQPSAAMRSPRMKPVHQAHRMLQTDGQHQQNKESHRTDSIEREEKPRYI